MPGRRNRNDVDAEIDLHGQTAEQLRVTLQQRWPAWRNLDRVRIVHGQGTVLKPSIERWCAETGVPYLPDTRNAGALCIFPRQRTLPDSRFGNTLKDRGLRLSPEQEAELRDPAAAELARREAGRRALAEGQQRRAQEAARAANQRGDEALWQAEMNRLGVLDQKREKAKADGKPRPPIIVPKLRLQFEEGYWKAELSRVADTDTETLQVQKKTGLDKLAPPMKEEPQVPPEPGRPRTPAASRDAAAEQALFEQEMQRLGEFDGFQIRRAKTE
jgi:hypothetical protein